MQVAFGPAFAADSGLAASGRSLDSSGLRIIEDVDGNVCLYNSLSQEDVELDGAYTWALQGLDDMGTDQPGRYLYRELRRPAGIEADGDDESDDNIVRTELLGRCRVHVYGCAGLGRGLPDVGFIIAG